VANDFSAVIQTAVVNALMVLRSKTVMPALSSRESEYKAEEISSQGETVQIPVHEALSVSDVAAGSTPLSATASDPTYVNVSLDQWKETNFYVTDKEAGEILNMGDLFNNKVNSAANALAKSANEYLFSLVDDAPVTGKPGGIYNAVGIAGTTPFASTMDIINEASALLNKHDAPIENRYAVLDYSAGSNLKNIAKFSEVDKRGADGTLLNGTLGRAYGFDFFEDGQIPYHNASGTAATMTIVASSTSNALIVNMADASGLFSIGDILAISGGVQTYMVIASAGISSGISGTISVTPAISGTFATATAITHSADQRVNLAFQRGAFAFANRPLGNALSLYAGGGAPINIFEMTDPLTGISIRLEIIRQNKRYVWQWDMLYGGQIIRPELAVRIMG